MSVTLETIFNNSRCRKCEDVLLKELCHIVPEHQDENCYSVAWCWWAVTLFSVGGKRGSCILPRLPDRQGTLERDIHGAQGAKSPSVTR